MVNNPVKTSKATARHIEVKPASKKIERVYLVVAELETGEGIYSVFGTAGQTLPIVAVDDKDLSKLSEYAQDQVKKTGRTVSIIGFTKRIHHETFRPFTTGDKK